MGALKHAAPALLAVAMAGAAAEIAVPRGGDLQAALDRAKPGDAVVLAAGAVYRGNFVLRPKGGSPEAVTLRSSEAARIPEGVRLRPQDFPLLAIIETPDATPALDAADRAGPFRFTAIEIRPAPGIYVMDLVRLGSSTKTVEALPHDFVFDRVYIHGDPRAGSKRGIALNCRGGVVRDSRITDFKSTEQDTQAIAGWNGPGPFTLTNNYLEAAGENVLFGDPEPAIAGLVPSDITLEGNHFFKPLAWRPGSPGYGGTAWAVKNLFELKSARRVRLTGNVLENCWVSAQAGFAIVLTVRTQLGRNPSAVVRDVVITRNLVRHAGGGVNILGVDDNGLGQASAITITQNVFLDIDGARWSSGPGRLFQVLNGVRELSIERNTAFVDGAVLMADLAPSPGLVFRGNVVTAGQYGVAGSGMGEGSATIARYFPGAAFRDNVVIGADGERYPGGNRFPSKPADVGFRDLPAGDVALRERSGYAGEGADFDAVHALAEAALSGRRP